MKVSRIMVMERVEDAGHGSGAFAVALQTLARFVIRPYHHFGISHFVVIGFACQSEIPRAGSEEDGEDILNAGFTLLGPRLSSSFCAERLDRVYPGGLSDRKPAGQQSHRKHRQSHEG